MKRILSILKKDYKHVIIRCVFIISIGITVQGYVHLNNFRGKVFNIITAFDAALPFIKYFVIAYIAWYIYVGLIMFYFAVCDKKKFFKLLISINAGMLICYVIYYFFPTMVERPVIASNDFFSKIVKLIYKRDHPYNCFPSIHVLDSVLCAAYINRENNIKLKTKLISSFISVMIIFSTFFIKQHYIYDAVSAAALSYALYYTLNFKDIKARRQVKLGTAADDVNNEGV